MSDPEQPIDPASYRIDLEQLVRSRLKSFENWPHFCKRLFLKVVGWIICEREINGFLEANAHLKDFAFIDRVFEYLNITFIVSERDKRKIPRKGRIIIVSNHPLGALDGLALLKLVGEVRKDVKIVAAAELTAFKSIKNLILPVNNLNNNTSITQYKNILKSLFEENAIILFPSGNISELNLNGIRDSEWNSGFLKLSRKTDTEILFLKIATYNSITYYTSNFLFGRLSILLLSRNIFFQKNKSITIKTPPSNSLD